MPAGLTKERIIAEIQRTAAENGGAPLGQRRFQTETGIVVGSWHGKYWRNWSEAVREAGLEANAASEAYGHEALALALTKLAAKLGRFPTGADIGLEKRADPAFPGKTAFDSLGTRAARVEAVRACASACPEYRNVLAILPEPEQTAGDNGATEGVDGAVYMLKLGKHYKIGKSFRVPQRHREIAIELPEKPDVVHVITTDDPTGIEAYWHKRFADRNTNGEWFALTRDDVQAFKRRRFM